MTNKYLRHNMSISNCKILFNLKKGLNMGLWEQIVKGKVRRCIDAKAVSYDYANNLAKNIAAEL
jgi:hypothetical protein